MNKIITIGMTIMLTSCGGGGGGGTDIGAALITAGGSGTGGNGGNNTTTPTVSLSASSYEVVAGDTITLNWSSSNATSCTASGSWSGEQALSGNENIEFLPSDIGGYYFNIDCSGATASVEINVTDKDSEGSCTNPHTAKIERNYLGDFDAKTPQNSFGDDHIKAIGLKDYGIGWIYQAYKDQNPSLVADCTKTEYVRLMYRETLRRLRDHGVTTVQIYNFSGWSDEGDWEVVHASKHITDEEVEFITQTGQDFGLDIYYAWQFNMEVKDAAGNAVKVRDASGNLTNKLLFPFDGGNVKLDMELLKKIMDAHETHIYWEADRAESIGMDGISADWSAMWVNFRGLDNDASVDEEMEMRDYYMERMGQIVDGIRSRFNGKIIIGEGITWNDERVWDKVDIIKFGFPRFLTDDELEDGTVDLIETRAADYIERAYNAYYCYNGYPCWDRTSFNNNNHKMMFDLFAQSHMGFLSRGWIEDGFCVTGTVNNQTYDCIQQQVQPDFSAQAIWYEGVLRAIDKQSWFEVSGTTSSTGYWLSDTLMHDGIVEAFPSISQSIRGKPAEKIIKYWYTGEYEQYEPLYD
tara:strand:- start:1202 stop:2938 length:1737 start_codon:yes stop_codon:yes gene_type:complete